MAAGTIAAVMPHPEVDRDVLTEGAPVSPSGSWERVFSSFGAVASHRLSLDELEILVATTQGRQETLASPSAEEWLSWDLRGADLVIGEEDKAWWGRLPVPAYDEEYFRRYEAVILWVRELLLAGVPPPMMSLVGRVAWRYLTADHAISRTPAAQRRDRTSPTLIPVVASSIKERRRIWEERQARQSTRPPLSGPLRDLVDESDEERYTNRCLSGTLLRLIEKSRQEVLAARRVSAPSSPLAPLPIPTAESSQPSDGMEGIVSPLVGPTDPLAPSFPPSLPLATMEPLMTGLIASSEVTITSSVTTSTGVVLKREKVVLATRRGICVQRAQREPIPVEEDEETRQEEQMTEDIHASVPATSSRTSVARTEPQPAESKQKSEREERRERKAAKRRQEAEEQRLLQHQQDVEEVEEIFRSSSALQSPPSATLASPHHETSPSLRHLRSLSSPFRGVDPPSLECLTSRMSLHTPSPQAQPASLSSASASPASPALGMRSASSGLSVSSRGSPPSPSSPFPAVRPARERRAWPATSGLGSAAARLPRVTRNSDPPEASSRAPGRQSQRGSHRGGDRRNLVPAPGRETAHSFQPRADDGKYQRVWRELLLRRLQRGTVSLSSARTGDDPLSEPGSDDERYGLRVMELEGYRSRPAASGCQPQWVIVPDDVRHVLRPWDEEVSPQAWHRQPRGVASEWFPFE